MKIFSSEADMQTWLSAELDNCDGLAHLIANIDEFKTWDSDRFATSRVLRSFTTCVSALYITEKLFENENISLSSGEVLKPDFVLYALEAESIVIVELKNLSAATREAGTELAAYSAEVRTAIPFLSDGDIVHVLISQEWPTLLRHFVWHEIVWQGRNLLCLQPFKNSDGEIRLRILDISELDEDSISIRIGDEYLGGYQICLYSNQLGMDKHVDRFRSALTSMAMTGNRLNSHGFAFLWKDHWKDSMAPYSITVLNFAPFQSVERFLHLGDDLPPMVTRFVRLLRDYAPEGHGNALDTITKSCTSLLSGVCKPRTEGYTHWRGLRQIMDGRAEHVAFVGWGLFGEALIEKLREAYEEGDTDVSSMSPQLGFAVVSEIVDRDYPFISPWAYFGDEDETDSS